MEIIPNSTIILLRNVPLESNYENTIYWTHDEVYTSKKQEDYFKRFQVKKFENQYYQRKDKGSLKLECKMESIYNCNYMMFKNESFENKWFYAFVDRIEYINNITCAIYYTIDIMQSYIGDYELNNCFVEREHSATDNVGDNIIEENLELGEYYSNSFQTTKDLNADISPDKIIVLAPFKYTPPTVEGQSGTFTDVLCTKQSGVVSGLYMNVFDNKIYVNEEDTTSGYSNFVKFLQDADSARHESRSKYRADEIVAMTTVNSTIFNTSTYKDNGYKAFSVIKENLNSSTLDGYTPKNKKLLTYPYNFMYVTNFQGGNAIFPYEFFKDEQTCSFKIFGDISPNPQVMIVPLNYKGVYNSSTGIAGKPNFDEEMTIGSYPTVSWNTDAWKSYWAQNGMSTAFKIATGVAEMGLGVATGNPILIGMGAVGATTSLATMGANYNLPTTTYNSMPSTQLNFGAQNPSAGFGVAQSLAQTYAHFVAPNQSHGSQGVGLLTGNELLNFGIAQKSIRSNFAKNIDGYFTMYGYATKRIKKPNTGNTRYNCTYIRTIGCTINGSVPADDEKAICTIHDNGVRYWNGANVYNGNVKVAEYIVNGNYIDNLPIQ